MKIILFAVVLAASGISFVSCSNSGGLSIRLAPSLRAPVKRAVAPDVDAMDCYFVSVDFSGTSAAGVPSCFGVGRVSALGTYAAVTSAGLSLRVPLGFNRRFRIWGVGTAGACSGKTTAAELFSGGARPSVFPIADQTIKSFGASSVSLTNQYIVGVSPNTGACDGPPPSVGVATVLEGLHRGGVVVPVMGAGYEIGARVSIGGTDCTSTEYISATEVQCTTPAKSPATNLAVAVRNPNGITVTSSSTYTSRALLLASQDDTGIGLLSYEVNPDTAALTLVDTEDFSGGTLMVKGVSIHPSGKWVVKAVETGGTFKFNALPIDPATGELGSEVVSAGFANLGVFRFSPDGKYLVVLNDNGLPGRKVFSFDSSTGAVAEVLPQSPASPLSGGIRIEFNRAGTEFYAALSGGNAPFAYSLTAAGLTAVLTVTGLAASSSYFELLSGRNTILVVNPFSSLHSHDIGTASWSLQDTLPSLTSVPLKLVSAPSGTYAHAFVSETGMKVKPLFVGPTGTLSQGSAVSFDIPGAGDIAADPSGKFLASCDDTNPKGVFLYSISQTTSEISTPFITSNTQDGIKDVTFD